MGTNIQPIPILEVHLKPEQWHSTDGDAFEHMNSARAGAQQQGQKYTCIQSSILLDNQQQNLVFYSSYEARRGLMYDRLKYFAKVTKNPIYCYNNAVFEYRTDRSCSIV